MPHHKPRNARRAVAAAVAIGEPMPDAVVSQSNAVVNGTPLPAAGAAAVRVECECSAYNAELNAELREAVATAERERDVARAESGRLTLQLTNAAVGRCCLTR
jgi:7-keto-8-aminopelargonate synthetase-like enzyme